MKIWKILLKLPVMVWIVVASGFDVFGCRCEIPAVCQAYGRADSVFVGRLVRVVDDENSPVETVFAHFDVEKIFKGKSGKTQIVKFVIGSCERSFSIGEKYFVYNQGVGTLNILCNMTRPLSDATADFKYASSLSESEPIFTIKGTISGLAESELIKTTVSVENGKRKHSITIDKGGSYEFIAKEKTSYTVKISLPIKANVFTNNLGIQEKIVGSEMSYSVEFGVE